MTPRPTPEEQPGGALTLFAIYGAVIAAVLALHVAFPAVFP